MKKVGLIVFIIALILGLGFASVVSWGKASAKLFNFEFRIGGVKGSGNTVTETREVTGFRGVDVGGVFNVEIVAQKDFSVQIEADDNLLEFVKTEVNDGILEISTTKRIKSRNGIKIRVAAPDIEQLDVSGVAKVSVTDLKNAAFKLDTSGASKVTLAGVTDKLIIDVSGASKIDAEALQARAVTVDTSGASKVSVFATESLRSKASGASKVTYTGGATDVVTNTTGASKVEQK